MRENALRLGFFAALFVCWELIVRLGIWPDYLFPGPLQVFDALRHGVEDLTLFYAIATSLRREDLGPHAISIDVQEGRAGG